MAAATRAPAFWLDRSSDAATLTVLLSRLPAHRFPRDSGPPELCRLYFRLFELPPAASSPIHIRKYRIRAVIVYEFLG